jgi:hypothetical protein
LTRATGFDVAAFEAVYHAGECDLFLVAEVFATCPHVRWAAGDFNTTSFMGEFV